MQTTANIATNKVTADALDKSVPLGGAKTVILTCNTGQGHNTAASAVSKAYSERGLCCDTVDALSFISGKASEIIGSWHSKIYRNMPKVFDAGYRICENHPKLFEEGSLIREFLISGSKRLFSYLSEGGYDCVICPHVFSALMMTHIRKKLPESGFRTCFITTDYTFAPITRELDVDLYLLPDPQLADIYSANGVSPEKIRVICGIPVRSEFYSCLAKDTAKRLVGVKDGFDHVLMMFGSMGAGPLQKLTEELDGVLPEKTRLTVVCGTNKKAMRLLLKEYQDGGRIDINICGFVDNISLLMDSSDLYITKPGGLSISEARIKRLPMLLVNTVSGCEQDNFEFFLEKGAAVSSDNREELAPLCRELLLDKPRLKRMSEVFDNRYVSARQVVDIMTGVPEHTE